MDCQGEVNGNRHADQGMLCWPGPAYDAVHRASLPTGLHISAATGTSADRSRLPGARRSAEGCANVHLLEVNTNVSFYDIQLKLRPDSLTRQYYMTPTHDNSKDLQYLLSKVHKSNVSLVFQHLQLIVILCVQMELKRNGKPQYHERYSMTKLTAVSKLWQ